MIHDIYPLRTKRKYLKKQSPKQYTKAACAQILRMSEAHLSKLERGIHFPSPHKAEEVADWYGVHEMHVYYPARFIGDRRTEPALIINGKIINREEIYDALATFERTRQPVILTIGE